MLANIFLHVVLDEWFVQDVQPRLKGKSFLIRFADDFIIGCECEADARRVLEVLPKRFNRFKLTIHPEKTKLVRFAQPSPKEKTEKENGTFDFLGFTHFWAKSLHGYWFIKRKTIGKRLRRFMKAIWEWCRENLHDQDVMQDYLRLFSFMPPQGDNWYAFQRKAGLLAYGNKLDSANHTFIASLQVSRIDRLFTNKNEFLMFLKSSRPRANNTSPDRFNVIVHDEASDNSRSAFCTKFHLKAEDRVASKSSGILSILESKGFTCLLPDEPLIVNIEYSERSNSPFDNEGLQREGEGFINSLQLK